MYKKNDTITVAIETLELPDTGIAALCGYRIKIKGALPGQTVSARIKKRRENNITAQLLNVLEKAPYETGSSCPHSDICGGCKFRGVPYEKQLEFKEEAVLSLFRNNGIRTGVYRGVYGSPEIYGYRNKMEFSFGDTGLGGELSLGMRKKNSWYEAVFVSDCKLIDDDMKAVLKETLSYFKQKKTPYYNTRRREGVLRHLVLRKSMRYGGILVNLVTVPDVDTALIDGFRDAILALELKGRIEGVLHTENGSLSDIVRLDNVRILYGRDYFYERVLGLDFKITPASFFQTNTFCAELLYKKALEFAGDSKLVCDLYCGTGTITQLIALRAEKAIGIEIVPDAVLSARETCEMNGIKNAEFICGDVFESIDTLDKKPYLIIADPPREGIRPKALKSMAEIGACKIIYISCNPSSLVRDLHVLKEYGYSVSEMAVVDMFPFCGHAEVICMLENI